MKPPWHRCDNRQESTYYWYHTFDADQVGFLISTFYIIHVLTPFIQKDKQNNIGVYVLA